MTDALFITASPLSRALAKELRLASRMLTDLADDLGSDSAVLRRHMTSLQAIDHVNQIQAIIADFLCDEGDAEKFLNAIALTDLARRLRRSLSSSGF